MDGWRGWMRNTGPSWDEVAAEGDRLNELRRMKKAILQVPASSRTDEADRLLCALRRKLRPVLPDNFDPRSDDRELCQVLPEIFPEDVAKLRKRFRRLGLPVESLNSPNP